MESRAGAGNREQLNFLGSLKDIPTKKKRAPPKPLAYYKQQFNNRQEAMAKVYLSGHYTLNEVGVVFDDSDATVCRAVK